MAEAPAAAGPSLQLTTLDDCGLVIGRYPRFRYNASGGGGTSAPRLDGDSVRFPPEQLTIPPLGNVRVTIPGPLRPFPQMIPSHCGEIGRPGTRLRQVIQDLGAETRLVREFRVFENPYHHFFQFERR